MSAVVLAECVACGANREIRAGDVAPDDVPACDRCFGPMIAVCASVLGMLDPDERKMTDDDVIQLVFARGYVCAGYTVHKGRRVYLHPSKLRKLVRIGHLESREIRDATTGNVHYEFFLADQSIRRFLEDRRK